MKTYSVRADKELQKNVKKIQQKSPYKITASEIIRKAIKDLSEKNENR